MSDFEWEDEENNEVDHDKEYYIHLHEKNKEYLENIDIDNSPHVRIIDKHEDNHLIEYHTSPGGFENQGLYSNHGVIKSNYFILIPGFLKKTKI